jgi:hypothetical protein
MAQSNIEIQIVKFRPNGSGYCLVEMVPDASFHGNPPNDGNLIIPTSYKIRMKRKAGLHKVKFSVTTSAHSDDQTESYCLVGVFFINSNLSTMGEIVAQHFITKFECKIGANPPTLTLYLDRDVISKPEEYEFMLLAQRLSDGALGIIDPEWEND